MMNIKAIPAYVERAPESREMIRGIFSRMKCRDCGECCKKTVDCFRVPVQRNDPNYNLIKQAAERRFPEKIDRSPVDGCDILPKGEYCGFIEENDGIYSCSIYGIRPVICAEFPFVTDVLPFSQYGDVPVKVLTSSCPPVEELKDRGVNYVTVDDLVTPVEKKGDKEYLMHVTVLSQAFLRVMAHVQEMPDLQHFTVIDNKLAFVIDIISDAP